MTKKKKIESFNSEKFKENPDKIEEKITLTTAKKQIPERIDQYLTREIKNASRTKVRKAIDEGHVTINGKKVKPSQKVKANQRIDCIIYRLPPIELIPQDIPLNIVYEDDHLLVVNKPAGMVVHPGVGNRYGTLVNALIYHLGQRESVSIEADDEEDDDNEYIFGKSEIRPGIVHRLDKNTSGLLVIAKDNNLIPKLQEQFKDRTVSRTYNALVWGKKLEDEGRIEGNIDRSNYDRKKFSVVKRGGKTAITDYKVLERFPIASLVELKLQTGRTHQIRVHMSHIKHPVIGDDFYEGDKVQYHGAIGELKNLAKYVLSRSKRQLLHAKELTFYHPVLKKQMRFTSELPEDFQTVRDILINFQQND